MGLPEGKVAIVTGAAMGVGRAEALELAAQGAAVICNDLGTTVDGRTGDTGAPVQAVVNRIREAGGRAVPNTADVGVWDTGEALVAQAIEEFGRLDIVVNNAGVLRTAPLVEMKEDDLDILMRVHFKGTYGLLHHVGRHWADRYEDGEDAHRAVINTGSSAGLVGGVGSLSAYGALKAGIAALTMSSALELARYDVSVNAIAPVGLTRMNAFSRRLDEQTEPEFDGYEDRDPANNAPLVAWLASAEAAYLTGQVFEVFGGKITHWHPWSPGVTLRRHSSGRWEADELGRPMATEVFGTSPAGMPDPSTAKDSWRNE